VGALYADAVTDAGRSTVEQMLAEARAVIRRLSPKETDAAMRSGALLIDIRPETLRRRDGVVPGSRFIERNVLEWRCDPSSPWRNPDVARPERELIVMCDAGYQSSLAAATLKQLGLSRATDLIGGFQAWRSAGLPIETES
jgi:rhodanese-related sulfurtransferase